MKHPEAPLFPLHREYRISKLLTSNRWIYRVEYKTWLLRRWKSCSAAYDSRLRAESEQRAIKYGHPDWMPAR